MKLFVGAGGGGRVGVRMSELLQGRTVRPCTADSPLCSSFCGPHHRSAPKNPSTSSICTLHVSLTYPFPLSLSLISSPSLSLISSHISPSRFLILSPSYCSWAGGACGQWWLGSMAQVAGVVWQCWYIWESRKNPQAYGYRCSFHLRVFQDLFNPKEREYVIYGSGSSKDTTPVGSRV